MKTIIIANGIISNPELLRNMLQPGDRLIAADGGALHCLKLNLVPEKVIGDLDSLEETPIVKLKEWGAKIVQYPARKDETDLELALKDAVQDGADELVVFGALGARWDMSLANVLILAHPDFKNVRISLVDGNQEVRLLQAGSKLMIEGEFGDTVSLIPVAGDAQGIHTSGLEYPLANETLRFGVTRGVSNVLRDAQATISLDGGMLLCVVIHRSG